MKLKPFIGIENFSENSVHIIKMKNRDKLTLKFSQYEHHLERQIRNNSIIKPLSMIKTAFQLSFFLLIQ